MTLSVIKYGFAALCAIMLCASCGRTDRADSFELSGKLINGMTAKTAYLYEYLPEYGKINMIDSVAVCSGSFRFSGSRDIPVEAFVRLDSCDNAYYFMLSNARLNMRIGKNGYAVDGTADNYVVSSLVMRQRQAVNSRIEIQRSYGRQIADSTLTKQSEDSLLRLYRQIPDDFRKSLYQAIDTNAVVNKPLADLLFRMFSVELPVVEADSLAKKLQIGMR